MGTFLPDFVGHILSLEAELVRLARARDRHPPDSGELGALDSPRLGGSQRAMAEWGTAR